jgi:hypothetical protein
LLNDKLPSLIGSSNQFIDKGAALAQKHSRETAQGRLVWYTERLWALAQDLPVKSVAIERITELDQNCWFGPDSPPTCRAVARHVQRILDADLAYPIILSADGGLMDGGHRLAKAWLLGNTEILAVQFLQDPEPDHILPAGAALRSLNEIERTTV